MIKKKKKNQKRCKRWRMNWLSKWCEFPRRAPAFPQSLLLLFCFDISVWIISIVVGICELSINWIAALSVPSGSSKPCNYASAWRVAECLIRDSDLIDSRRSFLMQPPWILSVAKQTQVLPATIKSRRENKKEKNPTHMINLYIYTVCGSIYRCKNKS